MRKESRRVRVVKSDPPESKEILAKSIIDIGNAAKKLYDSGLNLRAIIILLHHETKVPMGQIKAILQGLKQLESWYCHSPGTWSR